MGYSIIPAGTRNQRQNEVHTGVAGQDIHHQLNRSSLVKEHKLIVEISQNFSAAPTSVDIGRAFDTIRVEHDGDHNPFNISGSNLVHMNNFFEGATLIESNLIVGTSTLKFALDLHYAMPETYRSMISAIEASVLTTFDLFMRVASDTDNAFRGGTSSGAASVTVSSISIDYPSMVDIGERIPELVGIGAASRSVTEKNAPITTGGKQSPIMLTTGGLVHAVMLVVEDWTGGSFVGYRNDVVTDVQLLRGGDDPIKDTFFGIRSDNVSERGIDRLHDGVAVIDFGDDESGFLDLRHVAQPRLEYNVSLPAGVTDAKMFVIQDGLYVPEGMFGA